MTKKITSGCIRKIVCFVVILLLSANSVFVSSRAAGLSEKEILNLFSDVSSARYDDTCILMSHKDLAVFVANTIGQYGYNVDIIYDDEDSTVSEQQYILMCAPESNPTKFLPLGVNLTVSSKDKVLVLYMYLLTSQWDNRQIQQVMPAFTAVYDGIHGSMTDDNRRNFATSDNLARSASGYSFSGNYDGLGYELRFTQENVSFSVLPLSGSGQNAIAAQYQPGYEVYTDKDYIIRSGALSKDSQGNVLLEIDLVNKGKNPLRFHMPYLHVGGYNVPEIIYTVVAPGNTKTEQVLLNASLLNCAGVESIDDLYLFFRIQDEKTGKILYDYYDAIPLVMEIQGKSHSYEADIFKNKDFHLSVIGSYANPSYPGPRIYLTLENGVYGDVYVESSGNCVVGKQEYDLFSSGRVDGYNTGLCIVTPEIYDLNGTTKVEFMLQIRSYNYNTLVEGKVTVTFNSDGTIRNVSSQMKETAQYKQILKQEY